MSSKIVSLLNYKIRRLLPEPVKRVLRVAKLAFSSDPPAAPPIPQELLDNCRFLSSREEMLKHLPRGGRVCEVGSLYGNYSRQIIDVCAPAEFHLLDLDFSKLRADVANDPRVTKHQGMSVDILSRFPDNHFEWIYIDADHTYEGVRADIAAAMTKVRPGGYLVFNDFARIVQTGFGTFGVHQAVCEFAAARKWPFAFFCFQANALYDVALKRPS